MFTYETSIKLHDSDASGLIYFANQLRIAHEAFEAFMESLGFGVAEAICTLEFLLPITHAEADYKSPLVIGDRITVGLTIERLGETSITVSYTLTKEDGTQTGTAKTVHVAVDRRTKLKRPLPNALRQAIGATLS